MKKTMLFLCFILLVNASCEIDDFCLKNPITESLVIKFYDNTSTETLKNVQDLYIWVAGKDSIYKGGRSNTITLPLNSVNTETIYNFSNGTTVDTFTITYTPVEEYVSRSCGYKVIFNDVTFSASNNWIQSFTPDALTTIENQEEAHVQIFH